MIQHNAGTINPERIMQVEDSTRQLEITADIISKLSHELRARLDKVIYVSSKNEEEIPNIKPDICEFSTRQMAIVYILRDVEKTLNFILSNLEI